MIDPNGSIPISIWAAAFIQPRYIWYIHPLDKNAMWSGDGRTWNEQTTFESSRVWYQINFDTCDISQVTRDNDTGLTKAWILIPLPLLIPIYLEDQAPRTPIASVHFQQDSSKQFESLQLGIVGDSSNPLIPSPPIEMRYTITFKMTPNQIDIEIESELDRYPWHELVIHVGGMSNQFVFKRQAPLGPLYDPTDLALSAIHESNKFSLVERPFDCGSDNGYEEFNVNNHYQLVKDLNNGNTCLYNSFV